MDENRQRRWQEVIRQIISIRDSRYTDNFMGKRKGQRDTGVSRLEEWNLCASKAFHVGLWITAMVLHEDGSDKFIPLQGFDEQRLGVGRQRGVDLVLGDFIAPWGGSK